MNTSEDKMYIYNGTEEDIKFPNNVIYPSEATDGSIGAQTIKDNFNNHINTLKPNETLKILQEIFGPGANIEKEQRKIKITDVTLREGDQAPLTSFDKDEKKVVYLLLRELGIDTIEVGFPGGKIDYENIEDLLDFFKDDPNPPYVSVLGRCLEIDSDASFNVLKNSKKIRIHTFIATSEAHIIDKFCKGEKNRTLKEGKKFVLNGIKKQITALKEKQELLRSEGKDMIIEFSPEDATNSKYDFLLKAIRVAIEAGANVINVPDTLGVSTPNLYKTLFYLLSEDTKDLKEKGYDFSFSTHVHNDKDMATACTLGGVEGGADTVETTLFGIGEGAGNTPTVSALINFKIDGEKNGSFNVEGINSQFTSIFHETVKKILGFNPIYNIPGIGKNVELEGSGVHNANQGVYRGSKSYASEFGVLKGEEYFSARGGINGMKNSLNNLVGGKEELNISKDFKDDEARTAQKVRRQFPSSTFSNYLKTNGDLSDFEHNITSGKNIKLNFSILGEQIEINEDFRGENGYIDALINGLKKYLGKEGENITLGKFVASEKQKLSNIVKDLKRDVERLIENGYTGPSEYFNKKINDILDILPNGEETSESDSLVHFKFYIDGKERNSVNTGKNEVKTIIKSILDIFVPKIYMKIKEVQMGTGTHK